MFHTPHPAISLLFAFGLMILVLMPLLAWFLLHGHHDKKSQLWFAGAALYAGTALLFAFQYRLPSFLAFTTGSALSVLFYFFTRASMQAELEDTQTPWREYVYLTLLFVLISSSLDWLNLRKTWGLLFNSVIFSWLALINCRLCLRVQRQYQSRGCFVLVCMFGTFSVLHAIRAGLTVFGSHGVALLDFELFSNIFLVCIFLAAICYSFGYWGFVLEKTRLEKNTATLKALQAMEYQRAAEAVAAQLQSLVAQRDQMVMLNSRFSAANSLAVFNTAIVHEVSQPLQAIQLCLESLRFKMAASVSAAIQQDLKNATDLIMKLGKTMAALRTLIAEQQNELVPVEVSGLLQEVLPIVRADAELHGILFEVALEKEAVTILADKILLERVVLNLVTNALDSLKSVHRPSTTSTLRITSSLGSGVHQRPFWALQVVDNGAGIPEDMLRLIAEPLQTRKINGIGMGLALANLILRQWQGYLTARNLPIEEGGGACVEIRVPIAG